MMNSTATKPANSTIKNATIVPLPKVPQVPKDARLFWEHNLLIQVRAQPALETFRVYVSFKGEEIAKVPGAETREEANGLVRDALESIGLDKLLRDTLIEMLDHDAALENLKGVDYPSSTIHVTVA